MSPSIPARRQTVLHRVVAAESNLENLRFDLSQDISSEEMERNAEWLMDALFADVERMMERGVLVPLDETVAVAPVAPPAAEAPAPVVVPLESILPPKLAPRDLIPQPVELAEPEPEVASSEVEPEAQQTSESAPAKGGSLLWLAVLCSSLLLSAGILSYLFRDQVTQLWLTLLNPTAQPTSTGTASPAPQDADFLNYIRQSLDRLAHRAEPDQIAASPSPTLPNSPDASAPPAVERVYVPVYPSPAANPSVSSPTRIPTVATSPLSPQPVAPAVAPSSVAPPAVPRPDAANPPNSGAPSAVPNIAAVTHTLIGILALGERSAALFEINGTPQRVEMGEQIGSSGWTLVSINNQEAIVRRNGEVRSIYVGQKF